MNPLFLPSGAVVFSLPSALRSLVLGSAWLGAQALANAAGVQVEVRGPDSAPLAGAVVFLESDAARRQVRPLAGLEMAQQSRAFQPGVLVVPVGSAVHFPNHDSVRHHVYSFSPAKKFELKLYSGKPANPVLFDQSGVVVLGCNIHDAMVGWVLVVETPYYAHSTAPEGRARIEGVPPGNYRLRTWHPRLPVGAAATDQALSVPAQGDVRASAALTGLVAP